MAFALRFNNPLSGQGDQADLASSIAMGVGEYFEMDAIIPNSNPTSALTLTQDNSNWLGFNGTQAARGRVGGTFYTGTAGSMTPYLDVLTTYRFTRTATGYEITADGNLLLSFTNATQLTISRWGQGGTSSYVNMDWYQGRYYNASDVLVHQWTPSGTGSMVTDSVGTNDLTLTNFPTDDSQYISIAGIISVDGSTATPTLFSGETSIAFTTSAFDPTSVSITDGNNTLPLTGFTYSLNAGTFNMPVLGDIPNHPKFGACDISMTDGVDTFTFGVIYDIESPYQDTTISGKVNTTDSIDFGWVDPLVNGDQFALDTTYAVPLSDPNNNPDSTFTVTTALEDFTSRAFIVDSDGMEEFVFSSDTVSGTIPVESRTPPWKLASYLRSTESLEGSTNDVIFKWLEGQGYTGALNDMWMQYWEAQGYTGSYPDMRYKWLKTT